MALDAATLALVANEPTKMCRGEMARYIIKNRIEKPEELKSFNWEGFCFDAEHSTESQYLFSLLS